MNRRHGGLSPADSAEILDFSANINPLGPPPWLRDLISREIEQLGRYPEPDAAGLCRTAAGVFGIEASQVVAGNGATELLYALCRAESRRSAIIPAPCYDDYFDAAAQAGITVRELPLKAEEGFVLDSDALAEAIEREAEPVLVILGAPNNPTGLLPPRESLIDLMRRFPGALFCMDESFLDFCDSGRTSYAVEGLVNCVVIKSLTKFYGIPGLRLGLLLGSPELCDRVRQELPAWSVNSLAQQVGKRALVDREYAEASRATTSRLRKALMQLLRGSGEFTVYPGEANFLLCRAQSRRMAEEIADRLARESIVVRRCEDIRGIDGRYLRFAVRPEAELARLAAGLDNERQHSSRPAPNRRGAVLMIQGTSSNAGKSLLTAALCRIMTRRGLKVAPFKAQNMALNSSVTPLGGEIGRAQALQAAACGIEPDVRMNPVLLKPSSDTASQIIELGRPIGRYSAADYYQFKSRLWSSVTESLDSLREEYELVIIEGAGSPGEVNLRRGDIVNMAVALYARAPVLLVGDIDRGGIFASFVGTLEVLPEDERSLIAGFLVNKFRGDPSLLSEAYDYMLMRTGKPVLGTIPYHRDHGLPEEDSVSFKESLKESRNGTGEESAGDANLTIAFIDLPHISNFTDLDPLRGIPGLTLVPILPDTNEDRLLQADACIIPGSKAVVQDLVYLESTGIAERVKRYAAERRGLLLGICGGLQLLGTRIDDPRGVESNLASKEALAILPYATALAETKQTRLRQAFLEGSSEPQQGYEIHHGLSDWGDLPVLLRSPEGDTLGVRSETEPVWATYLHGILENPLFLRRFLDEASRLRGKPPFGELPLYDLNRRIDRFADQVEAAVDLERITALIEQQG